MKRFKLIITVVISLLAVAGILQNTQPIEITFLFWNFTLPAAVLLIITLLAGVVTGLTTALFRGRPEKRAAGEKEKKSFGKSTSGK